MPGLNALRGEAFASEICESACSSWNEDCHGHLPQVQVIARSVAVRYRPELELDELVSAGFFGLVDALEKFDASKGIQFKTYAEFRIRGAILDRLRKLDPLPKWLRQKGKHIEKTGRRLEQKLGRPVLPDELADEMGLDLSELQHLQQRLAARNVAICREDSVEDEDSVSESQLRSSQPTPFHECLASEVRDILRDRIAKLPEREQLVLSLRYQNELSMKEIGDILNLHQSRISQLHNKAVLTLRQLLPASLDRGVWGTTATA
ncbi:MAG TPA: FliA/WhiG family RNA polymerase sigma factor [Acidobacteriota bacterium]|nr:FliA/WhiG family RNA polymerase sigma factor [Acidobacteriota bacterium]